MEIKKKQIFSLLHSDQNENSIIEKNKVYFKVRIYC